jgi:hypothetical protein
MTPNRFNAKLVTYNQAPKTENPKTDYKLLPSAWKTPKVFWKTLHAVKKPLGFLKTIRDF